MTNKPNVSVELVVFHPTFAVHFKQIVRQSATVIARQKQENWLSAKYWNLMYIYVLWTPRKEEEERSESNSI